MGAVVSKTDVACGSPSLAAGKVPLSRGSHDDLAVEPPKVDAEARARNGNDGLGRSYVGELLLATGYEIFGMVRRASTDVLGHIEHLRGWLALRPVDLLDHASLISLLREV